MFRFKKPPTFAARNNPTSTAGKHLFMVSSFLNKRTFTVVALCIVLTQCGKKDTRPYGLPVVPQQDLTPPETALFKKLDPARTGVQFRNVLNEDWNMNYLLYPYLYNSAGVGILDVNKDGLQDIFFASTLASCHLYLNKGGLQFQEIAASAGVEARGGIKTAVAIADINADGWEDIYVCRTGIASDNTSRNLLYINNRDNTFSERAAAYHLDDPGASTAAVFFDYDLDGDLDAYIANHPADMAKANSAELVQNPDGSTTRQTKPKTLAESDHLLRNDGHTFTDVTTQSGIAERGFTLSVTATDVNEDGYPDLFLANDYVEPDLLYINNRNGTFTDQREKSLRHITNNSMGCDVGDINNDGLSDFVVLDMLAENYQLQKARISNARPERYFTLMKYGYGRQESRNVLQMNNGNGTYSDIGCLAGIFQTDWSWGCLLEDFDLDGWQDLYVTNGFYRDVNNGDYIHFTSDSVNRVHKGMINEVTIPDIRTYLALIPQFRLLNYAYRNKGDLTFENVSVAWGLEQESYSNGLATADLDNDGDTDLVVNNIEDAAFVYQNTAADRSIGHWLQVQLQGAAGNLHANGVKIRLFCGGQVMTREVQPVRGFMSSVSSVIHQKQLLVGTNNAPVQCFVLQ